ncbi:MULTISPECIES: ferredoxin [unclassified Mycobacterium]|uniref:ferredoxin n=1 Tax=unclassified Mycobacterium TaxID=2642494 RepID=UPI000991F8AC|nr:MULTISPECIES: ferredoxin [unclassified Mycobacterium]
MIRTDNRLVDSPMVAVGCQHCGAEVLARKSSWQQTSVQWNAEAEARCPQRRDCAGLFLVCSELRGSILDAARNGRLPVLAEEYGV